MVALGLKLRAARPIGAPAAEGYFAARLTHNVVVGATAAQRATAMLLDKLAGRAFASEVPLPVFPPQPGAAAVRDLGHADDRPGDRRRPGAAGQPGRHRGPGRDALRRLQHRGPGGPRRRQYDISHRGYDTTYVKQDPHRLVPVDVARELEQEGAIGKLHETVYSTTGVATTLAHSQRMGREIAAKLRAAGVDAVILTST